eukprot:scaffold25_cov342-Pavlova_lutheri.AAC.68
MVNREVYVPVDPYRTPFRPPFVPPILGYGLSSSVGGSVFADARIVSAWERGGAERCTQEGGTSTWSRGEGHHRDTTLDPLLGERTRLSTPSPERTEEKKKEDWTKHGWTVLRSTDVGRHRETRRRRLEPRAQGRNGKWESQRDTRDRSAGFREVAHRRRPSKPTRKNPTHGRSNPNRWRCIRRKAQRSAHLLATEEEGEQAPTDLGA